MPDWRGSRENEGLTWGVVISAVVHVVLVGLVVLAYRGEPHRQSLMEEFVTFLVPPDKETGRHGEKPMDWSGLGREGTATAPKPAAEVKAAPVEQPAADSGGKGEAATVPALVGDTVLTELQVDSVVRRYEESASPEYPPAMLARNLEGRALVTYVVDTTGLADTASFRVLETTHPDFAEAVRQALPKMRFHPAILGGSKVRQLVQQSFGFKIARPDSTPPPEKKPPGMSSSVSTRGVRGTN
jgi:TonB family protein